LVTKRGNRKIQQTTIVWKFKLKWKDGTTYWFQLKDLKESNPVEVAEYVTYLGIKDDTAFAWWVP